MKKKKLGFRLPNWGANSNLSFGSDPTIMPAFDIAANGPDPTIMPAFDIAANDLGTSDFATANMSGVGGETGGYQPLEFGMNIPTARLGLTGLSTLGNLWGSFQSNKLARDSFNFQKGMAEKNYANQIKSYNTALTDRATTRGFVQGDSTDTTQQYISDNKL